MSTLCSCRPLPSRLQFIFESVCCNIRPMHTYVYFVNICPRVQWPLSLWLTRTFCLQTWDHNKRHEKPSQRLTDDIKNKQKNAPNFLHDHRSAPCYTVLACTQGPYVVGRGLGIKLSMRASKARRRSSITSVICFLAARAFSCIDIQHHQGKTEASHGLTSSESWVQRTHGRSAGTMSLKSIGSPIMMCTWRQHITQGQEDAWFNQHSAGTQSG